jgi:hypothetical protein
MRRSALPLALCALAALAFSPVAAMRVPDDEKRDIDTWVLSNDLDEVGNPRGTMYTGGTPLFDERSGRRVDRYEYIVRAHPDRPWKTRPWATRSHQMRNRFSTMSSFYTTPTTKKKKRAVGSRVAGDPNRRRRPGITGSSPAGTGSEARRLSVDRAEHGERRGGARGGARARRLATPMRARRERANSKGFSTSTTRVVGSARKNLV